MLRGFEFECPPKELTAFGLRMQLLSLGISSSKSALDLLLGGRYSIAFAAIRHMIESHVFCRYVEAFPAQASAFYLARLGEPPPPKKPAMRTVIDRLVEVSTDQRDKRLFNDSYDVWKELIDGSHPSAVEITLTLGERDGLGVFEPTYCREFCELGFNRGLSATGKIVHEVGRIQSKDEELEAEMIRLAIRPAQFYGASLDP